MKDQIADLFYETIKPAFIEDMHITSIEEASDLVNHLIKLIQNMDLDDIISDEDEDEDEKL
jgi:hypothetical protein